MVSNEFTETEAHMHSTVSMAIALTVIGVIGLVRSVTNWRNARRVRLDRGLREYISTIQQ
jgi:hypothetical protein